MLTIKARPLILLLCASAVLLLAEKYNGPRPPKADLPYLLHASSLIPTEELKATENEKGKETIASVPGETSTARTPLPEPIFLLKSGKLAAERLQLFKFEIKNGQRQVVIGARKASKTARPIPLIVSRLEEGLYRVEANQYLEDGQYGLSPDGSDEVFCFEVY
ncbi:MAG: hypothetical protein IT160_01965 [Bryobacterales bacterium]|nr:hypothetical protein [Bryobacterales bacterium]